MSIPPETSILCTSLLGLQILCSDAAAAHDGLDCLRLQIMVTNQGKPMNH